MNNLSIEQIGQITKSRFASVLLERLLMDENGIEYAKKLAVEDVAFARFCERIGIEGMCEWRELAWTR